MWREWILHDGLILGGYLGYKLGQSVRLLSASQNWSAMQIKEHQGRALSRADAALLRSCALLSKRDALQRFGAQGFPGSG